MSATRRAAPCSSGSRAGIAKGAAGKWTDAATGEHGDLLDVIRESCGLVDFRDVADEARRFLSLPHPEPEPRPTPQMPAPAPAGSPEAARRLFAMSQPISGTLVEAYLRRRGITALHGTGSAALPPALLLSAGRAQPDRDLAGDDRRRHRSRRQAHRRASHLARSRGSRGNARQGADRHAATRDGRPAWATPSASAWRARSWRPAKASRPCCRCDASLPTMPMVAALSAAHLAAILFPRHSAPALHRPRRRSGRRRRDGDVDRPGAGGRDRGDRAVASARGLQRRSAPARASMRFGQRCRVQIAPQDVARFMEMAA